MQQEGLVWWKRTLLLVIEDKESTLGKEGLCLATNYETFYEHFHPESAYPVSKYTQANYILCTCVYPLDLKKVKNKHSVCLKWFSGWHFSLP